MFSLLKKTLISLKKFGFKKTIKRILTYKPRKAGSHFSSIKAETFLSKSEKLLQRNMTFPKTLKISIITPLYNTPEQFLEEMINSVILQTYGNWELCLADGSDESHSNIRSICENYVKEDKRIKYKKLEKNLGISGNSNEAIKIASGEYLGLLDHDDMLHPSALYEAVSAICHKTADFIYTDEAVFNNNHKIFLKHYKPDYAIDTLRSCNYICHFTVFSKKLMENAGYFRSEFDGSQDHDLVLRYTSISSKVVHIPKILYFWRSHENSVASKIDNKSYTITAGINAVNDHLRQNGIAAKIEPAQVGPAIYYRLNYELLERPLVSIIILNKDNVSLLQNCLSSIMNKTTYDNYEIIIIENNSTEQATFVYYDELKQYKNVHILYWEGAGFNYSAKNNFGAQFAKGKQLIFLNNDVEVITANWIEEMLMYSQRKDVGAVGVKLYYPDDTIQHAGVVLGIGGVAGHIYHNATRDNLGFMGKLHIVQNLSAVTAACMMVRKSVFEEIGFFEPQFHASWSDVDLCLRIRSAGYLIVWTPYVEAYHYESKTRGYPDTPEKIAIFEKEVDLFQAKWAKELAAGDPYYNCNFLLDIADYSVKK